jgi:transposase
MVDFFWFSDSQWSRIEPLLPVNGKEARRVDDRRVISGIVHALQSGGRWGDCPPVYGPKKTLYNRFVRWAERGIWEGIFSALAGADGVPDRLFIDSWTPAITSRISGGDVIQRQRGDTADASIEPVFAIGASGSAEPGRRSA